MRFILIALIASALALAWQPTVFADISVDNRAFLADDTDREKNEQGPGDEEPECE